MAGDRARASGRGARGALGFGAALLMAGACGATNAPATTTTAVRAPETWPAPAGDRGEPCADVGPVRICWGAGASTATTGAALVARPLPEVPALSAMGWRCFGEGDARRCADRALAAAPFTCAGGHCTQARPRLPDDGEWSCADAAGAAVCVDGGRAAGVAAAQPDTGWICGRRRRAGDADADADGKGGEERGRRVCVDLSPDFPDGEMAGWRCGYAAAPASERRCDRAPGAHQLADACDAARPCVDGARCVAGRCAPARAPTPDCWLDSDCPDGACRFGACRAEDRQAPPLAAPARAATGSSERRAENAAGPARESAWIVLEPAGELPVADVVRSRPAGLVRDAFRAGRALMVAVDAVAASRGRELTLDVDGACPITVALGQLGPGRPVRRALHAWLEIDASPSGGPVGFGATFALQVRAGCPEARAGRIEWRPIAGPALGQLTAPGDGFRVTGRMPAFADAVTRPPPWGVIPLSARTTAEVVLQARWQDGAGRTVTRQVALAAAPRSRGLGNTPTGGRVYLAGRGWRLLEAPPGSHAVIETVAGTDGAATSFAADVSGGWTLADGDGRRLHLQSARYDQTPLDCGRSGCHADIARAVDPSPMTSILARGLAGAFGDRVGADAHGPWRQGYPDCAIACHATGEPGLPDGGFADVAAALGAAGVVRPAIPAGARAAGGSAPWDALPRALRRAGGVGCMACHGPGAIPEARSRGDILRADVCAVCHDAPPRYGHTVAWQSSAMSRADASPRVRGDAACARCHTTRGFLSALRAAPVAGRSAAADGDAPDAPIGLGCATCHAVHEHQDRSAGDRSSRASAAAGPGARPALLRATTTPPVLAGAAPAALAGPSAICLGCHAPDPTAARPDASAAALWLGRGGVDPASGRPLDGPAPHAGAGGGAGCVGCHGEGPEPLERGGSHGFRASRAGCAAGSCHARGIVEPDIRGRARALWAAWLARAPLPPRADRPVAAPAPPHAAAAGRGRAAAPATAIDRALWNLALVLEDPAAAAHNAPYAQQLLDAAEPVLLASAARRRSAGNTHGAGR